MRDCLIKNFRVPYCQQLLPIKLNQYISQRKIESERVVGTKVCYAKRLHLRTLEYFVRPLIPSCLTTAKLSTYLSTELITSTTTTKTVYVVERYLTELNVPYK